jgi:hypothetical protein
MKSPQRQGGVFGCGLAMKSGTGSATKPQADFLSSIFAPFTSRLYPKDL